MIGHRPTEEQRPVPGLATVGEVLVALQPPVVGAGLPTRADLGLIDAPAGAVIR